jgi:hypothetical protein
MTQKELDAAVAVAKAALAEIHVFGQPASKYIPDDKLVGVVQDALQAAEDVRRAAEAAAKEKAEGKGT